MKNRFILKLASWFVLFLTLMVAIFVLSIVFYIFSHFKDASVLKIVFVDMAIIILGVIIFAGGLGVFEILRNYAGMEDQIQKLKDDFKYAAEIRQLNKRTPWQYRRTVRSQYR